MIELVARRRSDDVMSAGIYIVIAIHTLAVLFSNNNVAIHALPGSDITFWSWGVATLLACLVSLIALGVRSMELERASLTALATSTVAYSMSGFVIIDIGKYPSQTTSILAFALSLVMIHHLMRITKQIETSRAVSEAAERNETLKKGLVEEGG